MRILFVTASCPFAPSYGGQIRTLNIARQLKRCGDVSIAMVPRKAPPRELIERTEGEFSQVYLWPLTAKPVQGIRGRVSHELDPYYLATHGWTLDEKSREELLQEIDRHDLVWIHGLSTANNTGIRNWPHTILDIDDVLSQFYRSEARNARGLKSKVRAARARWIWSRRESVLFDRFTELAVCSERDWKYLGSDPRVHVIPNGYGTNPQAPVREPAEPPRIGFIGTLNYAPNRDGVEWFLSQVWTKIKAKCPDVRLRLVGDDSGSKMSATGDDVDRLGFVDDAAAEFGTWALSIVPIRIGGGTRIKIAEAFSRKCPVVATSWGAFGYDVESGKELFLADDPEEFADACVTLVKDQEAASKMAERAWMRYLREWTWDAIGEKVSSAVSDCLKRNGPTQSPEKAPA